MTVAGGLPLLWIGAVSLREVPSVLAAVVSGRAILLIANTALLALLAAFFSGLVGTLLGVLIAKTDLPARSLLAALLTLPLFLPPFIVALAWFNVLGRQGLAAALFGAGIGARASGFFFGLGGAVLVLTTAYTPVAMHLVRIALGSVDPTIEEAARLRVRWRRVVWAIDLPLVAPAIGLATLLTFVLVAGEFAAAAYLRYPVFSTEVFTQFAAFLNIHGAVAMSIPLTLLVLGGLGVERYLLRDRVLFLTRVRAAGGPRVPLGRWRIPAGAAAWAYAVFTVVLPLGALTLRAGSLEHYGAALRGARTSLVRSVWMSATAATLMVGLGFLLAYLVERAGRGRREAVDTFLLLLFAAPGTVLGVGLILLWNRAGLTWLYGSAAIVVVGWVAHFTPLAARAIGIGLRSLPLAMEEAARLAGVGWERAVWRILVPLTRPALLGAWFLTFVFCLRDVDLAVTIYPPGAETLPIRVYTLMANSPEPVTAALALLMVALTVATLLIGWGALWVARAWSTPWP